MVAPEELHYGLTANEREVLQGLWSEPRRIMAIQASPRGKRGATETVLSGLLGGMKSTGAVTETVWLAELEALNCKGCFKCWKGPNSRCPLEDGLARLIPKIPSYDMMVWATPVYVDGVPAGLKNFIDRSMILNHPSAVVQEGLYIHPSRHVRMPNLVLAAVSGFPGTANFRHLTDYIAAVGRHMHMPLVATIFRPETLSFITPGGREFLSTLEADLADAGREVIHLGRITTELSDRIARQILEEEGYLELANSWWH